MLDPYYGPYIFMPSSLEEENEDDEILLRNRELKMFSLENALKHGNSFENEYIPYKKYVPFLPQVKTNKDQLMLKIMMYTHVGQDLKLLLDVYPKNIELQKKYKEITKSTNELVRQYEEKFGPLFAGNSNNENMIFSWVNTKSVFEN